MHQKRERFLGAFVYGGIDGTVTTFAVVAGATWWNLDTHVIIILWFANIIADGISMSFGNYLSTQADAEEYMHEHRHPKTGQLAPWQTATVTFSAFILMGCMPMLVYILQYLGVHILPEHVFFWWSMVTLLTFIIIWGVKWIVTHTSVLRSVLETVWLGTIAAVLAYYVANVLSQFIR